MIERSASWLVCWGLLLGCPQQVEPEPPITLADDDDDSAALADDDDSSALPDPRLQAWIADLETLGFGPDPLGSSQGRATGVVDLTPLGDWRLPDGTPVPGLGLHPDRDDLLEACEEIDSTSLDGLPSGADLGPALVLAPSTGDSATLLPEDGRYVLEDGPRLSSAGAWTLSDQDGALAIDWSAPGRPSGVLPGPGTFSLVSPRNITWTAGGGPVEILLLRFGSQTSTLNWEAIRCVAEDDGAFVLDPTPLAGPFTGDLVLSLTRAAWTGEGGSVFARTTAILANP